MTGTLQELFAAAVLFVAGHFVLSSAAVRGPLVRRLGEGRFLGLYSVLILAAFVWMLIAYGAAPPDPLWLTAPALNWVPVGVMPVALVLLVCGVTTPSPTLAGGEVLIGGRDATRGIMRVTRHPVMWATTLWAASHLAANGEAPNVVLMGSVAILSLAGMWHIDKKREARMGAAWGPILLTTSAVPFAALATGRAKMDWAGIGWWRPAVAVALYIVVVVVHEAIIGVSVRPL